MVIPLHQYKDKKVAVLGLGKSGASVVRALLAGGARVVAWDDNSKARTAVSDEIPDDNFVIRDPEEWNWQKISCLIPAPGVPLTHPAPHPLIARARTENCRITGELQLLREAVADACIIGITGTNGKSTTTALLGHILQQAGREAEIGGNIGTPILALKPLSKGQGVYVLELSSYQLDLAPDVRIDIALLLNLSADHIDRHGDMAGYVAAKRKIFAEQDQNSTAIVSVDDEYCRNIYEEMQRQREGMAQLLAISVEREVEEGVFVRDGLLYDAISGEAKQKADLRDIAGLRGRHNWQNAAAAYTICRVFGMQAQEILPHLHSFSGLRHRMQQVAVIDGVTFINDSKATNAEATAQALATFDNIYWIAGGRAKEEGITPLAKYFCKIRHAYLIGEAMEEFATTLAGKVAYTKCKTLERALAQARMDASAADAKGAVILLSPACSSFDQWNNFEQRGDAFCEVVFGI